MKNLLNKYNFTHNFEDLEFSLSEKSSKAKRVLWKKQCYHFDSKTYKLIDRIIEEFIGKSVNDAFSKYCKLIGNIDGRDYHFWKNFNNHSRFDRYYYDENYIIHENEKRPAKPIVWKSPDYKTELRHRLFNEIKYEDCKWSLKYNQSTYISEHKIWASYKDFISIKVAGEIIEFKTKKDPKYRKLQFQKIRKERLYRRRRKKFNKQKEYSWLTSAEIKALNDAWKNYVVNDVLTIPKHYKRDINCSNYGLKGIIIPKGFNNKLSCYGNKFNTLVLPHEFNSPLEAYDVNEIVFPFGYNNIGLQCNRQMLNINKYMRKYHLDYYEAGFEIAEMSEEFDLRNLPYLMSYIRNKRIDMILEEDL